ncbi:MAG: aminopeptidase N, partial [Bdellovibrionota bacterium]
MKDSAPQTIYLKDYRQPDFWIPQTELHFDLREDKTIVRSDLIVERNPAGRAGAPLVLDGEKLKLLKVSIDGRELGSKEFEATDSRLSITVMPDRCHLQIEVEIEPQKNLSCQGLYKSAGMFCTQCEAEAFRAITYFLDRPDVMSVFTVTIEAEKAKYPVLLSNGNPVRRRDLPGGRHEVTWNDPFKKPAYLFALIAGDLGVLEDTYTTGSGRTVKLEIYARHGVQDRCRHAMDALKWSMRWDEVTYGLEYDLDIYMIVVAEDANMGAMENKGLNVFNAHYVLANPQTATDTDYDGIAAVVAHEYFHNWTGNRVTCRDWFQLSLKEGLTVFRDQRFSADHGSEAVNRIEDVVRLRTNQFSEDAGPMAHPIRPEAYITIDNFYTMTVYEKGAEVIRMIETIVSREGFRKGMDLYFERHDGQAVTTEDFVAAMADANGVDLTQFRESWYDQAGTPTVKVATTFDPATKTFTVTLEQSCAPSPGQPVKKPYHIPIAVGLLGKDGRDLKPTEVLHLRESKQTFTFDGVQEKPVLSLLRKFSAPVRVEFGWSDDELAFLMAHDSDSFSRWEAAQTLAIRTIKQMVEMIQAGRPNEIEGAAARIVKAFGAVLGNETLDPDFKSYMLLMPAESYLAQFYSVVDVDAIYTARETLMLAIAQAHRSSFAAIYDRLLKSGTEGVGAQYPGLRSLKNRALHYLTMTDEKAALELAARQRREAKNMTDEVGALEALKRTSSPLRAQELAGFYEKWKNESLVMNKWLMIQAMAPIPNVLDDVKRLMSDPVFDKNNPNKVSSLIGSFTRANLVRFNDRSGSGYAFLADQVIEIDTRNPQLAARLASGFNQWKTLD